MNEELARQIELLTERLLRHMGPSTRVKVEPPSQPCHCVKREPASLFCPVKDAPVSPQRKRYVQIARWVKDEPSSPAPPH